eukprot:6062959-Pleurochrysis_carterae.AAC.1
MKEEGKSHSVSQFKGDVLTAVMRGDIEKWRNDDVRLTRHRREIAPRRALPTGTRRTASPRGHPCASARTTRVAPTPRGKGRAFCRNQRKIGQSQSCKPKSSQ